MTIQEILLEFLEENGFDGFSLGKRCCCDSTAFLECINMSQFCRPGYLVECDCATGVHEYHITEDSEYPNEVDEDEEEED